MSEDDLQRGRIQWLEGHAAGIKEAEERIAKAEQQRKELYRLRGDLFELRDVVTAENFAEMQKRAEAAEQQIQAQQEEIERLNGCLTDANAALMDWENREAAVCPEDVGFEELIRTLQATVTRLSAELRDEECSGIAQRMRMIEVHPQLRKAIDDTIKARADQESKPSPIKGESL